MPFTNDPPTCPNPTCGSMIGDSIRDLAIYSRLGGISGTNVVAVGCAYCNTLLGIIPSNLNDIHAIKQKVNQLR